MNRALSFCLIALLAAAPLADAQDKKLIPVTLAVLWYPQPEDGQFFAAKAEGIYEKHGLDVTIRPGGPQVNVQQLMAAGQSDFAQSSSMRTLNARNQGVPIVTVAGLQLGQLMAGSIILESVFALPGLGRLALGAITARDLPVVQGVTLFVASSIVLINFVVDLAYVVLDPRIRYE